VFDPGLGHVRVGFFFSLYDFTATIMDCREFPRDRGSDPFKITQKQTAREISRAGCGTYSRWATRVKAKRP
jgi:hypothetical protein